MAKETNFKLLERLPGWWRKDKVSNIFNIFKSFSQEMDDFSVERDNLVLELYVNTATGIYLDDIGKLFRLNRLPGESDDNFRSRIKAYWQGFIGGGTAQAIKNVVVGYTGVEPDVVDILPVPTFRVDINYLDIGGVDTDALAVEIGDRKAAGVNFKLAVDAPFPIEFIDHSESVAYGANYEEQDTVQLTNENINFNVDLLLGQNPGESLIWDEGNWDEKIWDGQEDDIGHSESVTISFSLIWDATGQEGLWDSGSWS